MFTSRTFSMTILSKKTKVIAPSQKFFEFDERDEDYLIYAGIGRVVEVEFETKLPCVLMTGLEYKDAGIIEWTFRALASENVGLYGR